MSEQIGEAVDEFEQMAARQVTIHQWRVLSWRNDSVTAYEVDLKELTCSCPDDEFNKTGPNACAHLAKALYVADRRMDVGEALNFDLLEQVREVQDHVEVIERRAAGVQADASAGAGSGGADASSGGSAGFSGDPIEAMEAEIAEYDLDPDDFKLWINEDYGSLNADTDAYLDDDEFAAWVDLKEDLGFEYDGNDDVNYLKADRFGEVFG